METKRAKLVDKAKKIKVIVADVDGVLTDGYVFVDNHGGEPFGRFSIYDGMGITIAQECDLKIIVLSGRKSACTEVRYRNLGVDEVYTGVENKKKKLLEISKRLALNLEEIAYIGDDLIDLGAMSIVGFKAAPKNAISFLKRRVDYITKTSGGEGALRELIELVLKAQCKYKEYIRKCLE